MARPTAARPGVANFHAPLVTRRLHSPLAISECGHGEALGSELNHSKVLLHISSNAWEITDLLTRSAAHVHGEPHAHATCTLACRQGRRHARHRLLDSPLIEGHHYFCTTTHNYKIKASAIKASACAWQDTHSCHCTLAGQTFRCCWLSYEQHPFVDMSLFIYEQHTGEAMSYGAWLRLPGACHWGL